MPDASYIRHANSPNAFSQNANSLVDEDQAINKLKIKHQNAQLRDGECDEIEDRPNMFSVNHNIRV
jgi:hypothetical protein